MELTFEIQYVYPDWSLDEVFDRLFLYIRDIVLNYLKSNILKFFFGLGRLYLPENFLGIKRFLFMSEFPRFPVAASIIPTHFIDLLNRSDFYTNMFCRILCVASRYTYLRTLSNV